MGTSMKEKDYSESKSNYEKKFAKKIQFRVTTKELKQIEAKSGALSLSEYAKKSTLNSKISVNIKSVEEVKALNSLIKELKMIGNNVNQIARNSNIEAIKENGNPDEMMLELNKILPLYRQILIDLMKKSIE